MVTDVISLVGSDGGDDYATFASWESAKPANLVTADERWIGEFRNETLTAFSNTVAGSTADATRCTLIRPMSGHGHGGSFTTGAEIANNSGGGAPGLALDEEYASVEDMRLRSTAGGFSLSVKRGTTTADRCMLRFNTGFGIFGNGVARNIAALCTNATPSGSGAGGSNVDTYGIYNAIFINAAIGVKTSTVSSFKAHYHNVVCFGCTTSYQDAGGGFDTANVLNCAASDGSTVTPPGTNPLTVDIVAGDFTDEPNDDYSLASGSQLIDAGVDTSALGVTVDIIGTSRSGTYDVGPWEFVAAGGGTILLPASDLALSTAAPTVSVSDHKAISLGAADLALSAEAPTVTVTTGASHEIALLASDLALDSTAPTVAVSDHHAISLGAADIALSSEAPTVAVSGIHAIELGASDLALDAQAPTVTVSDHKVIALPAANLALDSAAPTVFVSDHRVIALGASNLTLTGEAPTVAVNDNHAVALGSADLALDAAAPTVTVTDHHVIALGVADLALTSEAPTISSAIVVATFAGIQAAFTLGDIAGSAIGWTDTPTNDTPSYSAVATGDSNIWTDVDTAGEDADWSDVA